MNHQYISAEINLPFQTEGSYRFSPYLQRAQYPRRTNPDSIKKHYIAVGMGVNLRKIFQLLKCSFDLLINENGRLFFFCLSPLPRR